MFKRVGVGNASGSSYKTRIDIAPMMLRKLFGNPDESDGYKVSGEYVFANEKGHVFTIYDWKSTNLYDSAYPDPMELWNNNHKFQFHIGSNHQGDLEEFLLFLQTAGTLQLESAILDTQQ